MDARQQILDSVRANQPGHRDLPAVPMFHSGKRSLVSEFQRSLEFMSGEFVSEPPSDFGAYLHTKFPDAKNICSVVPEYAGNATVDGYRANWADAAEIDVSVVRSPLGIAETGSVFLSDRDLEVSTIGFLAHDLVVLLDPKVIVENVHDAYQHQGFREHNYSVLMTGPSGSADIGGTTVHPAQGVMTLTVIMWPAG